jgi:hypothetical protein
MVTVREYLYGVTDHGHDVTTSLVLEDDKLVFRFAYRVSSVEMELDVAEDIAKKMLMVVRAAKGDR